MSAVLPIAFEVDGSGAVEVKHVMNPPLEPLQRFQQPHRLFSRGGVCGAFVVTAAEMGEMIEEWRSW